MSKNNSFPIFQEISKQLQILKLSRISIMSQSMKAKALKKMLVTQLKQNYPSFNTHSKTAKKEIIKQMWEQVSNNYDVNSEPEIGV